MILPASRGAILWYFKICSQSKQKTFDFSPVWPNVFTVGKILVVYLEIVVSTCVIVVCAWVVVVVVGKILVVDLEAIVDICAVIVGTFLDVVLIAVVVGTAKVELDILVVIVIVFLVVGAVGCVISDDKKCKVLILI